MAQVAEMNARMGRCVQRGLDRSRERLEAQRRLLPRPDVLLAQSRQRADDLGERLRRGLSHRLARAGRELADVAGALRPSLLERRRDLSRQRLEAVRLSPHLLERRVADATGQLTALWRLAQSLNPDAPLSRGFARVMAGDKLIRSSAEALAAGHVTLKFGDGEVAATTGEGAPSPTPPATPSSSAASPPAQPRRKRADAPPGQSDLFG
jgi:exodeoxyribonuclease VII large subunit